MLIIKTEPTKKRKYKYILRVGARAENLPGWQEVPMDIDKINDSLEAARSVITRLKFDPGQPRDEQGQWRKVGMGLERIMKRFGADWLNVMARLDQEGALPDLLEGRLDLDKLAETPAIRALIKKYVSSQRRDARGRWTAMPAGYTVTTDEITANRREIGPQSSSRSYVARVYDSTGKQVAHADYTVGTGEYVGLDRKTHPNELRDSDSTVMYRPEVQISTIEVAPGHRRKGIGLGLLTTVAKETGLPMTRGKTTPEGEKLWAKWASRAERLVKFESVLKYEY